MIQISIRNPIKQTTIQRYSALLLRVIINVIRIRVNNNYVKQHDGLLDMRP